MSAEALYNAVKSGSVSLDSLNEDGKTALRGYMQSKQEPSVDSIMQSQHQTEQSAGVTPQPFSNDPVQPQQPSAWKGILDNPIVHGAETAFDYGIAKPLETVGTVIADISGAGNNLLTKPQQGYNGETIQPSQSRNLGQDIADIWTKKDGGQVAHNAMEGAFPNDFSKNLPGTNVSLGNIEENAAQFADLSPLLKGAKFGASKISDAFDNMFGKVKPAETAPIEQAQPVLGLPEPKSAILAREAQNRSVLPPNTDVIHGQGDIATLGLPEGQYTAPTRLKVSSPDETLSYVMGKIKPEVMQTIEAPARRDLLVQYIQKNMDIPLDEIHNMPMTQLQDLGQNIQQDLHAKMPQIAADVAAKYGHDLPSLLEGQAPSLRAQLAKDTQSQVYGVPAQKVNIARPDSFNIQHVADAAMPETKVKLSDVKGSLSDTKKVTDTPKLSDMRKSADQVAATVERPKLSDLKSPTKSVFNTLPKDELKFAQTVKQSENTNPALIEHLNEQTLTGKRTTDALNRENAQAFIDKHGQEGAANKIIAKQGTLTPHEVTAAQILAKQYSSMGGEANLNKALDLVGKTATKGREMGQAIQALSQWNKLDAEGALLQGSRSAGRTLTAAEGKPIIAATERIQQVAATKSLAEQVTHIITNKTPGEALTASEKDIIKQFNDQVKQVNEGVKSFLPKEKIVKEGKSDATIKEVSQIEPKARTRDQVVSFLDAKADKARARLTAARNKISSTPFDQYADMAIIGASHIAKGVVKLSDFTERMVKDFGSAIKPQINEIFNRANNIFRKENGLPTVQELDRTVNGAIKNGTFTEEQAHQFKAWANEIGHMSDEFKTEATQDLQKAMNQIGTSTLGQKLSAIQTSSQLLSIPTTLRNVIGNEAFNVIEKINKITAVPLDMLASTLTGERHIVFKTNNQESYWKNWVKGAKGGWNGISPNGQFAAMDIHPEVFKSDINPFKYLQKLTGTELQSFDHAAYMRVYGETVGTYATLLGKSQGLSGKALNEAIPDLIKKLDQSIHDLADEAGRYATFQDDTLLSKLAVKTKAGLNEYSTGKISDAAVKAGLPEKYSLRGFGAGDVVLKYAKTPANIVMRGIEYSPIGILRGLGELVPLLGKNEFNQRKAVLALSRGITGTLGMTGLGYALANVGVLTGAASSDKDIQQLDKMTGKGEYKVNWSALERYVMGGLDKNAAKWQKGDNIFDWGWLQPMAISLAMGVNAQQSVAKQKADGTQSWITTARDGLIGSIKTIVSQPLLQGVQSLSDAGVKIIKSQGNDWSGIANIAKGIPASFVPATLGQARNFSDNTSRITYDPSKLKTMLNMIINKIPGLEKQLPIAYDSLGNQKEQIQGGQGGTLKQGLLAMASPVKPTTYTVSPEAKMVMDLINSSGDTKPAPRTPNSYLMVDKKKVNLTPGQYSEIQQMTGEATQKALKQIAPMLANPNVTDAIKVKEVVNVLDKVGQQVRNNLNKEYPALRPHLKAR